MTTPSQLGFVTPSGTDFISDGDNAITKNAEASAQMYDTLLGRMISKGNSISGINWDEVRTPGVTTITSVSQAESMTGLPEAQPGVMEVVGGGGSSTTVMFQRYTVYGRTRARTWQRVSNSATTWSGWSIIAGDIGWLAATDDLDDLQSYIAAVRTPDHKTVANVPPGAGPGLVFTVQGKDTPQYAGMIYFEYAGFEGSGRVWFRTKRSSTAWNPTWTMLGGGSGATSKPVGLANSLRIDDFTQRWGGTVYTNGKAGVSIRVDHGLDNFYNIIRPLLEARNIEYTLALSSRHWDHSENAGVTPAMIDALVQGGLCTVANHGANAHQDATTYEDQVDQIANGLTELRAQIPSAMIDMWLMPGVGGSGMGGLGSGNSPESFYNTTAGQLILENHAVTSGAFPNSQIRVLDGRIRQGGAHVTMDSATTSAINTRLTQAVNAKGGLQLMIHPSNLNKEGYMTTAQLTTVLDNIVARRNAGELVTMSSYDLVRADSRPLPS